MTNNLFMRRALLQFSIYLFFVFMGFSTQAQNVGISSNGATPDNSAMLDVSSVGVNGKEYKGVLIPRVPLTSLTDNTTISNPAKSLLIYNSGNSIPSGYYYNAAETGATPNWVKLVTSNNTGNISNTGNITNTGAITNTGTITNNGDIIANTGTVKSINGTNKVALERFPMGELYLSGNTTPTTINTQNAWTKVAGTTSFSSGFYNFAADGNNRLRYTGSTGKHFHIACTLSLTCGTNAQNIKAVIAKNGTALTNGVVQTRVSGSGSTTDYTSTAIHVMTHMGKDDYLELWIMNTSGTTAITVTEMNLFAMGISMGEDF